MGLPDDTWMPDQLVCSKFSSNTFTSTHRDISVLQSKGKNTKLGSISDLEICLHFFCLKKVMSSSINFCDFLLEEEGCCGTGFE